MPPSSIVLLLRRSGSLSSHPQDPPCLVAVLPLVVSPTHFSRRASQPRPQEVSTLHYSSSIRLEDYAIRLARTRQRRTAASDVAEVAVVSVPCTHRAPLWWCSVP